MATSHKMTDKFLTCTVCMEVFTDPVTLCCQHTFCSNCLICFTKIQPEAVSNKSLPCPFCRKLTKVSEPERPIEDWVKDLKPSFLMQGLIDSFGPGTKDMSHCSFCKEEGETTPAAVWCSDCDEALCERCARMHKRIQSAQKHDIIGLTAEVKVTRKRKVMCKEHTDEKVEFLCKDCKKAVCLKCCTIYHRKCDSVVTMKSELSSMRSVLIKGKESLMAKLDVIKSDAAKKRSKATEVTQQYKQMESEIKSESQKAKQLIELKEKKLLDDLKSITDEELGKLKVSIKTGDMTILMYEQQSELIDKAVKSDCEMDIYELYQSCEIEETELADDPNTDTKNKRTVDRIRLRMNTNKLIETLSGLQLGEIDVMYEMDLKSALVLQDTINVKVTDDQYPVRPTDVIVLDVNGTDTVVVTDYNNESVKSFYRRNNQPRHSKLRLDADPWGVTQLKHNQVAVTVRSAKQIVTVEVRPDLKLVSTVKTNKQYYGITAVTPSTIAAGSYSPPSVDLLDMAGTVIRSIIPQIHNNVFVKDAEFLCTTEKNNILVCDRVSESVLCLTIDGDVVFNYSPGSTELEAPKGITVTNTRDINILVADRDQNRVLHLSESGQFVRNILTSQDGLSFPRGICVDNRGRLYICLRDAGVIKVFSS